MAIWIHLDSNLHHEPSLKAARGSTHNLAQRNDVVVTIKAYTGPWVAAFELPPISSFPSFPMFINKMSDQSEKPWKLKTDVMFTHLACSLAWRRWWPWGINEPERCARNRRENANGATSKHKETLHKRWQHTSNHEMWQIWMGRSVLNRKNYEIPMILAL